MSEEGNQGESSGSEESNTGEDGQGAGTEEQSAVSKQDFDALKEKHDKAFRKARKLQEEFDAYKKTQESAVAKKAKDEGDFQKQLEIMTSAHEREKERAEKLDSQLRAVVVESQVKEKAGKYSTNPNAVWALSRDSYDVEDDDSGNPRVVVKGGLDLETYLKAVVNEQLPETILSKRADGTGPPKKADSTTNTGDGAKPSVKQLREMGRSDRIKAMVKYPELQKEYMQSGGSS